MNRHAKHIEILPTGERVISNNEYISTKVMLNYIDRFREMGFTERLILRELHLDHMLVKRWQATGLGVASRVESALVYARRWSRVLRRLLNAAVRETRDIGRIVGNDESYF